MGLGKGMVERDVRDGIWAYGPLAAEEGGVCLCGCRV